VMTTTRTAASAAPAAPMAPARAGENGVLDLLSKWLVSAYVSRISCRQNHSTYESGPLPFEFPLPTLVGSNPPVGLAISGRVSILPSESVVVKSGTVYAWTFRTVNVDGLNDVVPRKKASRPVLVPEEPDDVAVPDVPEPEDVEEDPRLPELREVVVVEGPTEPEEEPLPVSGVSISRPVSYAI
jgi:hypothetical protein